MPFRVATFNTLNLNAPGLCFVGRPDEAPFTAQTFATRKARTAAMLDKLDADIVGFQEVFSSAALTEVIAASPRMAGATLFGFGAVPIPGAAGPNGEGVSDGPYVALASRLPVLRADPVPQFPDGMAITVPVGLHDAVSEILHLGIRSYERPLLRAEIEVEGLPGLVVLVAHLKSKRGKVLAGEDENDPVVRALASLRSLIVRGAEAAALRAQVLKERDSWIDGRRRPVIVLGDLNDGLSSVTTGMILGDRPRSFFTAPREDYAQMVRTLMVSAFDLHRMSAGADYTYVFQGAGSMIDHILLSCDFVKVEGGAQRATVIRAGIENDHLDAPGTAFQIPRPAKFAPVLQTDPLLDPEPENDPRGPKQKFDHGFPFADIEP